jgi:hypothetical protein
LDQSEVRELAGNAQKPRRPLQQREATMTTQETSNDADLFEVLSAISISGPDFDGLLWVSFKSDDEAMGALSLHADSVAGRAVMQWRDMHRTALAKAVLARASQPEK